MADRNPTTEDVRELIARVEDYLVASDPAVPRNLALIATAWIGLTGTLDRVGVRHGASITGWSAGAGDAFGKLAAWAESVGDRVPALDPRGHAIIASLCRTIRDSTLHNMGEERAQGQPDYWTFTSQEIVGEFMDYEPGYPKLLPILRDRGVLQFEPHRGRFKVRFNDPAKDSEFRSWLKTRPKGSKRRKA